MELYSRLTGSRQTMNMLNQRFQPLVLLAFLATACTAAGASDPPAPAGTPPTATSEATPDTLDSPYGPAAYGADGQVEIWRLPALAREDTFGVRLRYELREIEIQGERVTLREILQRAQEGERARRESVEDLTYTQQVRVSALGGRFGDDDRTRIFEEIERVYFKQPDRHLRVHLAEREYGDQEEEEKIEVRARVRVDVGDALDFAQAPFYLEDIDSYRYTIHDRQIFPDRVVYAVRFEPRSDFDVEPTGIFWIDAADFVVVHEEMGFEKNPAPLFLKSLDNIVRERRRVDGHWVVTRIQVMCEFRLTMLLGVKQVEAEITFSNFEFNTGLDDAIFRDSNGRRTRDESSEGEE